MIAGACSVSAALVHWFFYAKGIFPQVYGNHGVPKLYFDGAELAV